MLTQNSTGLYVMAGFGTVGAACGRSARFAGPTLSSMRRLTIGCRDLAEKALVITVSVSLAV